ncbi:hypothetical protein BDV96DRAFT_655755 [Lophiotrema nucula]|uniref:Uncharacterized protein n=1 Tax=Lophiotrema nucula TaxID=690887 RepID=A0A6A5YE08_9PLEO|nr:hypothetical protein BDV96DRAFT_655755 [Lophiotrema nucula]
MKGMIRRSLLACFFPPKQNRVQKSEKCYIECRAQLDQGKAAELAYVQLWAFCRRHFDQLSTFAPRKVIGKDKPVVMEQNPLLWQRLATFASNLGFRVPDATQLAEQQSRSQLAIDYLRKANHLSTEFSAAQIERVVLTGSLPDDPAEEVPELSTNPLLKERRFGQTFNPDLEEDKHYLFILTIYQEQDFPVVNLQFVRYDLFRCIFAPFRFSYYDFGPPKQYAVVHAVLTLDDSIAAGGMIWEAVSVSKIMENLAYIIPNETSTNEYTPR